MKKILLFILFFLSTNTFSNEVPRVKVFQDGNNVRIGIYLGCSFLQFSPITNPNIIITQVNNHFEIIMSLRRTPFYRCSPPPPEYIDEGRRYLDLGDLLPAQYTITTKYVVNDATLPPQPGVEIFVFDQSGFTVAHQVPIINKFGLIILVLLLGLITFKFRKKIFVIEN